MSSNLASSSRKIALRRLCSEDAELTFKWRNNPEIYIWSRQRDCLLFAEHKAWLFGLAGRNDLLMYMIYDPDLKIDLGVCGFINIDHLNRSAEFSIYISPDHKGYKYGEKALRALVDKGFLDYGFNRIWGETFEGNPALKMFSRLKFNVEGTKRQSYFKNGRFINSHIFSLLRSEYGTYQSAA